MSRKNPEGYVYFFHSAVSRRTKIGMSKWPGDRYRSLKTNVPDLTELAYVGTSNPRWLERTFHSAFASRREHGEWFALTSRDIDIVKNLPDYITSSSQLPPLLQARMLRTWAEKTEPDEDGEIRVHLQHSLVVLIAAIETLHGFKKKEFIKTLSVALQTQCKRLLRSAPLPMRRIVREVINQHCDSPPPRKPRR